MPQLAVTVAIASNNFVLPTMPSEAIESLPELDLQPANDEGAPASLLESAVFSGATSSDLQSLVDTPCRTLDVEYKSWRNLANNEDRAELARDIAALANHGGGHIVFGFHQDTLVAEDTDPFLTRCTQEQVSTIVRTYLDPPVPCEVTILRSAEGNLHPAIRVSGHGSVPVCIRQNGPLVGTARLIERGAYYTRKHRPSSLGKYIGIPRPETDCIETPQDWAPLIRRCVRQDREAFDAGLKAVLDEVRVNLDLAALNNFVHRWWISACDSAQDPEGRRRMHIRADQILAGEPTLQARPWREILAERESGR